MTARQSVARQDTAALDTVAQAPSEQDAGIQGEAPESPRAAMRTFLEHAEAGEYADAARFLMLDQLDAARGAELARRLYEVIRRRIVVDLDSISPLPQGDVDDGEPAFQDRVGRMYRDGEITRPIVLVRRTQGGTVRWMIGRETVTQVDREYASLTRSWTTGRLPPTLLEPGPFGIPRWKWLAMILALPVLGLVSHLIALMLRRVSTTIARRTRATWDDELVVRLRGPVRLLIASVLAVPIVVLLEFDANTTEALWRVLRALTIVALFWIALRTIGLAQDHLATKAWVSDRTNAQTIVPLIGRSLRVALGVVALLVALSMFGYPVGTVLAGLGLGGLVVALAAQKTVENLFGSVTLAADRVFRVGDWVKIEDVQGTVERIGLRSTHVRTLDRTLVKVPNGKLADLRIESFGERDRIRFFTTLGLDRGTTATQMRAVLRDVEALLREHPRVWPDGIAVRLAGIGQQALDVNVNAWFALTDWAAFEVIRQDLLLGIMDIVERAGTRLAVPMQILRIEGNGNGRLVAPEPAGDRAR